MKTACIMLRKEAPEANVRRQYAVSVENDLFGNALVVCRWGRIGANGRRRENVCGSVGEARSLERARRAKIERLLRDSAEGVTACEEYLKVMRMGQAVAWLGSDPEKACDRRERLILDAIGVPQGGWSAKLRHRLRA